MSKSEQLVARLLESDPDEIDDPKRQMLGTEPELTFWLEKNGFQSTLFNGVYKVGLAKMYPVLRLPVAPPWHYQIETDDATYTEMTEGDFKRRLIELGLAQP